ncbi:capsular biosynthesis protein [Dokdonia sp. Dokd-P16]|uniref:Stealth CR1 domain-containing protein n=1 Tax=Dokdonia sp. Dokd-P16 TaxID=2173169 RepID=UPI000D54A9DA|nr:Stealth CR1 domain-containing protein [Dokdonia sp. Dokd-P16]AWH74670.1 capsular biosynthesis protein [Dokdonia sp. Dokd-P16]
MTTEQTNDMNIDAVITWVNGDDLTWQYKINSYLDTKIDFSKKAESTRYNAIGEVQIAIASIIKFAPFIKNIYVVTDNQVPQDFEDLSIKAQKQGVNLKIIDHTVIFKDYEEALPSFNSISIEIMLYRIPNLSEHFVVFNDDFFLMRATAPEDFFINGMPVLRGSWEKFNEDRTLKVYYQKLLKLIGKEPDPNRPSFKRLQQQSAMLAGTKKYVRRYHTPMSVRKSTLVNYFNEHEDLLKKNISYRFRDKSQFLLSSLSEHLEIKKGTFHYSKDTQLTYFRSYKKPSSVKKKLAQFIDDPSKIFVTFQSLEKADPALLIYIKDWISARLTS